MNTLLAIARMWDATPDMDKMFIQLVFICAALLVFGVCVLAGRR